MAMLTKMIDGTATVIIFVHSTLFVSNLPYTATSTDIQTLFSDIAPVRSAFVVLDKETKVSKGVAYVSFAIKEDAALALESEKPLEIDGRVLRLQWADRKGVPHHSEKPSPVKAKKPPRPSAPSDPEAIRTLVVSNLPAGIDSKALWKKARKVKGASEVVFPAPGHDEHTAFVKFASPAEASAAVAKLHNHVFKGSRLSATIKKRVDKLVAGRKSAAPSRSSRLIIRNIPWHLKEKDLHEVFAPYGPIYSITFPTDAATGRHRGFAFVWMLSHGDAERALKGVNGRTVGAPKKQKKTRREREAAAREKAAARLRAAKGEQPEEEEKSESEEEEEEGKGSAKEGRVVAVDWALSKNKWEETVSQRQEEAMEVDEERSEEGSEEGGEEEEEGSEEEGSEEEGSEEEGSEEEGSEEEGSEEEGSEEEGSDEEAHERPKLPDTDVGTTLFVRNVPFEATEDDLRTLFRAFGPLRYARITLDHDTGRSRGTGFVCFWKKEDADAAIEEAETMAKELGTNTAGPSKVHNPFSMSLLTPDPSASLAQRLVLHGRTLSVARAVTRNEADRLREEGERSREKQDKRNLYLMLIFPNSTAAAGLTEAELATRQASFDARRALLRSNPSLYVSRTRLSVRRLPLWASERVLKRLAVYAIREYEAEVEKGARDPLTKNELQADPEEPKPKAKKGRNTGIQQAKIVRAADRVDAVTGKGRSRGYGFIETAVHADALRILRWTNNRPGVAGLMRGWWKEEVKDLIAASEGDRARRLKEELQRLDAEGDEARGSGKTLMLEFAIENVQVVRRRKERVEAVRTGVDGNAKKRKAIEPANEANEPIEPLKKRRKESKEHKAHSREKKSKPEKKIQAGKASGVDSSVKSGSVGNLGGIIGRKRRDKRKGKGN